METSPVVSASSAPLVGQSREPGAGIDTVMLPTNGGLEDNLSDGRRVAVPVGVHRLPVPGLVPPDHEGDLLGRPVETIRLTVHLETLEVQVITFLKEGIQA